MVKEQDGETTFSPTNSLNDHLNTEQISQNNHGRGISTHLAQPSIHEEAEAQRD